MSNIVEVVYGLGGYCANCNETHNHPLNNVVEIIYKEDEPEQ